MSRFQRIEFKVVDWLGLISDSRNFVVDESQVHVSSWHSRLGKAIESEPSVGKKETEDFQALLRFSRDVQ